MTNTEFVKEPQGKNVPYVKSFDSNGKLLNPIGDGYFSMWPNRKMRRPSKVRFNSGKYATIGNSRFVKILQLIPLKDGSLKKVFHYLPC